MKINLIGSNTQPNSKNIEVEYRPPDIISAFEGVVPDGTILDFTLSEGRFNWIKYEAPDGSGPPPDEVIWESYRKGVIKHKNKVQEFKLFHTPFISCFPPIDLEAIKEECLSHAQYSKNEEISNQGGYQGHAFESRILNDAIREVIPEPRGDADFKCDITDIYSWVNINGKGDTNLVHNHTSVFNQSLWCGVYYVQVNEDSGPIQFYDPRVGVTADVNHNYYVSCTDTFTIRPTPGQLVLFPSWLQHGVHANQSDEERISIAFNVHVKLREKDGQPQ